MPVCQASSLYSKVGIPNLRVLQIATWGGGISRTYCSWMGDPVADMSNIEHGDLVMKNGVIYDPAAIYRTIGVPSWREGRQAVP